MKKISILVKSMVLATSTIFFISCEKQDFITEVKDDFVFVLYEGIPIEEMDDVVEHLSTNLPRMMEDLSLTTLDEPIKIHVWKTNEAFLKQQKKNAGKAYPGSTGYVIKKESMGVRLSGRTKETIEHELAHILSYKLNKSIGNNPRWLWETIATYESNEFVSPKSHSTYAQGYFPSLESLNRPFNEGGRKIYDLGYIIGEYIMTEFGREGMKDLILSNGDIKEALGISQEDFENGWKEFARIKYL